MSVALSQANRVTTVAQADGEIGAAQLMVEVMAQQEVVDINAAVQQTSVLKTCMKNVWSTKFNASNANKPDSTPKKISSEGVMKLKKF